MWSCSSKSLKSIFYKKLCNCISHTSTRVAKHDKSLPKSSSILFSDSRRSYGQKKGHDTCGQFSEDWEKRENPRTGKGYCSNDFLNDFFGALRLSGIFAISWYLLQPFSHRKILYRHTSSEKCTFKILSKYTSDEYYKLINYFKNPVYSFNCILPEVKATRSKLQHDEGQNSSENDTEIDKSKLDNLQKAHHRVLGTLSNFLGAECMEHKKYSEAFFHFEAGAQVDNPAAIFNLGICHEMGLGTNQNFKKAAEMYKRASDLGHPTAMYNLAVFYVHGYGDLKTDINEARKLFKMAASLGQLNAKEALNLDSDEKISSNNVLKPSCYKKSFKTDENNKEYYSSKCREPCLKAKGLERFNIIYRMLSNEVKETGKTEEKCSSFDNSGALDLPPQNNVKMLLF